jgi:hypothetical protein
MTNINNGEYGQTLRVSFNEDVSTATAYNFVLEPKYGDKLEKTGTLGTVNIDVGDETWLANEYIEYILADGDIDQDGQWRKKGEATMSATDKRITDYSYFTVLD